MRRGLLACGVAAGPLFLVVVLLQAGTREGFDLGYHPASLLSVGEWGWIQVANFVLTGFLVVVCAFGLRQTFHPGRSGTWGPILVGAFGVGLAMSGIFPTDAGAGFPPGTPDGPGEISWHGILHEVGFAIAVGGMLAACFVFLRRFLQLRWRLWAAGSIAIPVGVVLLAAWPALEGLSIRLLAASMLLFGYLAALSLRAMEGVPRGTVPLRS